MASKIDRFNKTIPSLYNPLTNRFVKGLIEAWAEQDESATIQIDEAKDQIFLATADGRFLTELGHDRGVSRPLFIALADVFFRDLIVKMSYTPKQIRKTMYDVLDVFWGPTYSRANVTSQNTENYNFNLPTGLTGTLSYTEGSVIVSGSGTLFLSELSIGDYIRLATQDNSSFVKVVNVVSDTQVVVFVPAGASVSGSGVVFTSKTLSLKINDSEEFTIILHPKFFNETDNITADEIAQSINDSLTLATASTIRIFGVSDLAVNLRTATPGLQGAIQVTGGTANAILNFSTDRFTVDDLVRSTIIYEINPREIVLQVPNLVAKLIRTLRGAYHVNTPITGTITAINNIAKTLDIDFSETLDTDELAESFIAQGLSKISIISHGAGQNGVTVVMDPTADLSVLSLDSMRVILPNFPNSYVFDPANNFHITSRRTIIDQNIADGEIVTVLSVDDASNIPDEPGFLCLNFGKPNQETLVPYLSRPNNSTLILNSTYTFENTHLIGDILNFVVNEGYEPDDDGSDYAVYVTGTREALEVVQSLIDKIKAAGIVLRWAVEYPEYRFSC